MSGDCGNVFMCRAIYLEKVGRAHFKSLRRRKATRHVNEHVRYRPFTIRPGADLGESPLKSACSIACLTADIIV